MTPLRGDLSRVLHVQKVSGIGGSERHLLTLLPGLRAQFDVRMVVLATGDAKVFVDALRAIEVPVHTIRAGPDLNPAAALGVFREIAAFQPALVHSHLIHADVHALPLARLRRVPTVSTVHRGEYRSLAGPFRVAQRWGHRYADRVIAISDYVQRTISDHVPACRARVVQYGIDTVPWARAAEHRSRARAHLGIGPDDVLVGIASRLIKNKGHATAIEAFARASAVNQDLRMAIAGTGPLEETLRRRVRDLPSGSVRVLGFIEEIDSFLAACDVLLFPTSSRFHEGFGLAMLEAMATGVPVVATATGPMAEVVDDGRTGLLVPPDNPGLMAEAILRLASDRAVREAMGSAGQARARERFTVARMVDATMAVYEELGVQAVAR